MKKILITILILTLTICCNSSAFAQQTIVTVPSSDALPTGEIILKQSNKFTPWHESFVSLTPSVIVGTGKGTETFFAVGTTMDDGASVKLDIGTKKVFRLGKSARFTVGGRISPNLTDGKNPNSFLYAHGSYLFKKTRTTITSGVYVMGKEQAPNMTGALVGIDQTIIPNKFRVVADWMSRQDNGSAISAGFKIRPHAQTSITTAVIIPNCNDDRLAFSISVSQYIGNIKDIIKKDKESL